MKSNPQDNQNLLFNLACRGLKYFLLSLLGLTIAFILSGVFDFTWMMRLLEAPIFWVWLARIAISLFCLFAIAIVTESWN
ncbi:MAG: hypothetical protein MET45_01445 [Nostoc sp. LLA-1]|nr:hypothetical protein [Cyanocohniella sp. LLY]